MENKLTHHGVLGMKWGIRKDDRKAARADRKDANWATKKSAKIQTTLKKKIQKELNLYVKEQLNPTTKQRNADGKLSATYVNQYNQKMAELMNQNIGNLKAPSGKVVQFIAKRGEIGVYTALADQGYNMNLVKKGIHSSGRVAYRKTVINKAGGR